MALNIIYFLMFDLYHTVKSICYNSTLNNHHTLTTRKVTGKSMTYPPATAPNPSEKYIHHY